MAAHMYDLPGTPPFPVYGLDESYSGYRWLVIWNNQERLYTVSLGHGHPGDPLADHDRRASWLTVTTYLKTPAQRIVDSPYAEAGPTGYEYALFDALGALAERTLPKAAQSGRWVVDQINLTDWGSADKKDAPERHGPGWASRTTVVDGEPRSSMSVRLGGWWATLVDLPTVAVAVTGPDDMTEFGSLVDVRATPAGYH